MRLSWRQAAILVVAVLSEQAYPQAGNAGSTGLAFLKFAVGARASGMGEAYTAVTSDAYSTYWNPAALSDLSRAQLAFTHTEWLQEISNDFLAVSFRAFGGGVGLSIYANSVGGIERRTKPSAEPIAEVESHDVAFGISYGRQLSPNLAVGGTLKLIYEKIYLDSASGYAIDFAVKLKPLDLPLLMAFVIQNVGSMNELYLESPRLPTAARIGVAYQLLPSDGDTQLLFAVDWVKVLEAGVHSHFGVELGLRRTVAFRFGYQTGFDHKTLGGGMGFRFLRYQLDYGYTPFDSDLGDTHRFSFSVDL